MSSSQFDVIIIGGGLAGLVASLHLSHNGFHVCLFEPKQYPFHKVCGEYISNEVLPYLSSLDIDPFALNARRINRFELSSPSGRSIKADLPLGGFSISRYALDHHIYERSRDSGTKFIHRKVSAVEFRDDAFSVTTDERITYTSKIVLGSYGKRSSLDNYFQRSFAEIDSRYIGVKYHAEYDFPDDLVALHNFESGYCGVSMVETGHINICYLTTLKNIRQAGGLDNLESSIMSKNRHLARVMSGSRSVFGSPMTISNVSFDKKSLIEDHVLMTGDAAGMINPLSGNGMTMAIHSAKMAAEQADHYLEGRISRPVMESRYENNWNSTFRSRLFWGRQMQRLFGYTTPFDLSIRVMGQFPPLFQTLIRQTHGQPF
jgi:flavin-dependent dehydrogenase